MRCGKLFNRTSILILTAAVLIQGCVGPSLGKAKDLEAVQIKEYQGEKLSSINDFRENSINGPQQVDIGTYHLKVTGLVDTPVSYSYDDAISKHQSYTKLVTLNCVEGWSVKILWEGILVKDLISQAGIKPAARIIIFHASDGYTTSLPLQFVLEKNLLLAYKMNEVVLPPERGYPFELVAEDKWGYKWIKWVTEIELSDNIGYKGFWESYGYSNEGDLDKPFFER